MSKNVSPENFGFMKGEAGETIERYEAWPGIILPT